jgi:hypothetical protein
MHGAQTEDSEVARLHDLAWHPLSTLGPAYGEGLGAME